MNRFGHYLVFSFLLAAFLVPLAVFAQADPSDPAVTAAGQMIIQALTTHQWAMLISPLCAVLVYVLRTKAVNLTKIVPFFGTATGAVTLNLIVCFIGTFGTHFAATGTLLTWNTVLVAALNSILSYGFTSKVEDLLNKPPAPPPANSNPAGAPPVQPPAVTPPGKGFMTMRLSIALLAALLLVSPALALAQPAPVTAPATTTVSGEPSSSALCLQLGPNWSFHPGVSVAGFGYDLTVKSFVGAVTFSGLYFLDYKSLIAFGAGGSVQANGQTFNASATGGLVGPSLPLGNLVGRIGVFANYGLNKHVTIVAAPAVQF